jgi:hypothetical protein
MVPMAPATQVSAENPGSGAVFVGSVSGGKETNPLWVSQIDDAAFSEALTTALRENGLLAPSETDRRFRVDAALIEVKKPIIGFTFRVTTIVQYTVTDLTDGTKLIDDKISAAGAATMGDAFLGVERLRIANEASGRANIEAFIGRLVPALETVEPEPKPVSIPTS